MPLDIHERLAAAFLDLAPGDEPARWAHSGALALTGDPDRQPLVPQAPVAGVMTAAGALLEELAPGAIPDAPALLGERAALMGLGRAGRHSCGGACRLLEGADGWLAVSLARPDDWDSVEAWLGCEPTWDAVTRAVAAQPVGATDDGARLLGIPAATVLPPGAVTPSPWQMVGAGQARPIDGPPLVADLSALWAGPLCGDVWARSGARVIKVEDPSRPDGARRGHPGFFRLLNGSKHNLAVPLGSIELRRLLRDADVVITSGRQRAFAQAGIDPMEILAESPTVWVAITAYGWDTDRVGFGDDVAAGEGLVAWDPLDGAPRFVADAVADPLCGTLAAVAGLAAVRAGGSWLIDASLAAAAGYAAGRANPGPATIAGPALDIHPPRARRG